MKRILLSIGFIILCICLVSCVTEGNGNTNDIKWDIEFIVDEKVYEHQVINNLECATMPTDPKKEGYIFVGWYHGDLKFDFSTEVATNIILVARFVEEEKEVFYKVTFYVDDSVFYETNVLENSKATVVSTPSKVGYEFLYWATSDGVSYNFNNLVNCDLKLFAVFKEKEVDDSIYHTVRFLLNDELYYEVEVKDKEMVSCPVDPVLSSGVFFGWFLEDLEMKYDFDLSVENDLTLIGKYFYKNLPFNIEYSGYEEGLYVILDNTSEVDVYYNPDEDDTWDKVDQELIRVIDGKTRIDIVGLKADTYKVKLQFKNGAFYVITDISVKEIDRSGYAFFNNDEGVGAYNNDGTLKSDAVVLYVTNENKNTITYNGYTGLVAILQNQAKMNVPLNIRIIGSITTNQWKYKSTSPRLANNSNLQLDSFWKNDLETTYGENLVGLILRYSDKYLCKSVTYLSTTDGYLYYSEGSSSKKTTTYSKSEYSSISGKTVYDDDSYWNMLDVSNAKNVTIEGIGTDAEFFQFGLTWKNCSSIEVKNLTFTAYPEDACSFEGNSEDITKYGNYFVHNNQFNKGLNNWDVTGERDKADGDGAIDLRCFKGITVSYNVFNKTKKTGLVGGSDDVKTMNVTFHHNYYNEVGSRLPLGRQANMHIYNNYYYKCGTCLDIRANAFVYSEANYYENCTNTQKVTTSSTYKYTAIKSYLDYFVSSGASKGTIVSTRTQSVSGKCMPDGVTDYTNFDTNNKLFYYNNTTYVSDVMLLTDAQTAKADCLRLAGVLKN